MNTKKYLSINHGWDDHPADNMSIITDEDYAIYKAERKRPYYDFFLDDLKEITSTNLDEPELDPYYIEKFIEPIIWDLSKEPIAHKYERVMIKLKTILDIRIQQ